ncbi:MULTISPECIES: hypothetical protein [Hyphomicrobiales]|uniref:hypothetical protein n=1 Tax=Hyphomicrobiales TaxID=356 RepID=UPI00211A394D|nr:MULTISPECIES: hypothetical protein [Hyphomicrobiales]MCQ9147342.1 hypothetical protein [Ochrobactrum sp. BTU2]MDH1270340.1 hypothetical protein [Agrobacterium pusense]MDX4076589.1 hypothetical protein [Brucella sp. NBRC 113783]
MSLDQFLTLAPVIVITATFGFVAFMVNKLVNSGYAAKKQEKGKAGQQPVPPPMGEARVVAEMWDVILVAFLLVADAVIMVYALTLGPSDPRQVHGLMWTTVASLALAAYVVWRVHLIVNRTK